MTIAETILWRALRGSRFERVKFRRQVPVGPYVADFLCIEHALVVELDGPPHNTKDQQTHDRKRDAFLRARGLTVLRFSNDLIIGGCDLALKQIDAAIKSRTGERAPFSRAGGRRCHAKHDG